MNHWTSLPPSKQPKCKSYEVIKGSIKDPFTVAKLKIFSFIAGLLTLYLTIYQSQKPLIPFLYDDLQSLYKELLGLTIRPKVLENVNVKMKMWRWLQEAAENWTGWCKKSYGKEGYACGFWHTTRALIYTQKGLCHSQRCKHVLNWCKGVSCHITGENVW